MKHYLGVAREKGLTDEEVGAVQAIGHPKDPRELPDEPPIVLVETAEIVMALLRQGASMISRHIGDQFNLSG